MFERVENTIWVESKQIPRYESFIEFSRLTQPDSQIEKNKNNKNRFFDSTFQFPNGTLLIELRLAIFWIVFKFKFNLRLILIKNKTKLGGMHYFRSRIATTYLNLEFDQLFDLSLFVFGDLIIFSQILNYLIHTLVLLIYDNKTLTLFLSMLAGECFKIFENIID